MTPFEIQQLCDIFAPLHGAPYGEVRAAIMRPGFDAALKEACENARICVPPRILAAACLVVSDAREHGIGLYGQDLVRASQAWLSAVRADDATPSSVCAAAADLRRVYAAWRSRSHQVDEQMAQAIHATVTSMMTKAYWDTMYANLQQQRWEAVRVVLGDLQARVAALRSSSSHRLEAMFDVDLIMQILQHDAFSVEDFAQHFNPLVAEIKSLQSPGRDEPLDAAYSAVTAQITAGNDWRESFVSAVKTCTECVATIYADLCTLQQ